MHVYNTDKEQLQKMDFMYIISILYTLFILFIKKKIIILIGIWHMFQVFISSKFYKESQWLI